jgi:catechol 2,3-dioxygenase-like lactoylglutathione lyase family enzyme
MSPVPEADQGADGRLASGEFDVGGVVLPRPFKLRRLGHFGYNCRNMDAMLDFYVGGLGLIVSDQSPKMPERLPEEARNDLDESEQYIHFTRFSSDHHQLVFISQKVWDWVNRDNGASGASVNQITWQVCSLAEVVNGAVWISGRGEHLMRSGRDMPGSNWHTYLFDPEGHINELFYGMEQIGWDRTSKPRELWSGVLSELPILPRKSESSELHDARISGIPTDTGHKANDVDDVPYEVDGILMSRPFKITGIGPVSLFVEDLATARAFYRDVLGFTERAEVVSLGHDGVLMSIGTEHYSLALYDSGLRPVLGLTDNTDSMALGFRVANYRQLRDAIDYMIARGAKEVDVPSALVPGYDYVAHLKDPDGNLVQLYYYQRQHGPSDDAPETTSGLPSTWPEVVHAPEDVFGGQQFLGPWE